MNFLRKLFYIVCHTPNLKEKNEAKNAPNESENVSEYFHDVKVIILVY